MSQSLFNKSPRTHSNTMKSPFEMEQVNKELMTLLKQTKSLSKQYNNTPIMSKNGTYVSRVSNKAQTKQASQMRNQSLSFEKALIEELSKRSTKLAPNIPMEENPETQKLLDKYTYVLLEPVLDHPDLKKDTEASDHPRDGTDGRPPKKGKDRYQVARKLATKAYRGYHESRGNTEFKMIIRHKTMNPLLSKAYGVYDVKIESKNVIYKKDGKTINSMIQARPYKVPKDEKERMIQKYIRRTV